jgi:ABC-type sugar transport system permease subunit
MTVETLGQSARRRRRRGIQLTERHLPLALLLPSILIILLIVGFPMLYSLYLSFTNYNLTSPGDIRFIGLQNYVTC